MNKNVAIRVQNLTKTYKLYDKPVDRLKESLHPFKKKYHKDFHAIDNLSLEIKKGETVGIIGKNGSGKSTLLKIITGVLTPTNGRVTVHGKVSAILELGAGFNPEMTGLENIYLNTSINGMSKKDTDKKIDEIIAFAELGDFIHQPIKTYSSGMKARLAFAVSINVDPDILIVDEALSVGDAAFARKCFAKMEEIRSNGATILFVSHSEGSIVSLCSRAIWISNGAQVIDGTPKLVAGLYMKNINEKKIDKEKIEQEYAGLEGGVKQQKTKRPLKQQQPSAGESHAKISSETNEQKVETLEDFYNPALKPKSTICFEEKGARISDVKITTVDGDNVNILLQGNEYFISYKVYITEENNYVCGCYLTDVKGVILSGAVYPSLIKYSQYIKFEEENTYKIVYRLKALFNEGEYFLSTIVRSQKGNISHQIKDGYMLTIKRNNRHSNSIVDAIEPVEIMVV